MTDSEKTPTTPAECRAEQERVLTLLDYQAPVVTGEDLMYGFAPADETPDWRTLARQNAALLAAHAEALERERWIPVSERLPEEGVWVLVATHEVNSLGYFRYAQTAYLLGSEWYQVNGSVSHWHPLPAPPAPASAEGGAE